MTNDQVPKEIPCSNSQNAGMYRICGYAQVLSDGRGFKVQCREPTVITPGYACENIFLFCKLDAGERGRGRKITAAQQRQPYRGGLTRRKLLSGNDVTGVTGL
jgi:hypothetical protein